MWGEKERVGNVALVAVGEEKVPLSMKHKWKIKQSQSKKIKSERCLKKKQTLTSEVCTVRS